MFGRRQTGRDTQTKQCCTEETAISRVVRANNSSLRGRNVRLIDSDNEQLGIVPFEAALERAEEAGLDLVLVADRADPPVCRIMNYGKFVYQKSKREREQRKRQASQRLKEIKFHANTGEHDYQTKVNHLLDFLGKGHKVKVSLFFRGREMVHRDIGMDLLRKVIEDVGDAATVELQPRMAGRNLIMQLAPAGHK
jgi:translation initiation factor IF-3